MLSPEQIAGNRVRLNRVIQQYISEPRKSQLLDYYESIDEIVTLAPASSTESFHSAFPGGYLDHVLRVVDLSIKFNELWSYEMDVQSQYTIEELIFTALHHDLGKLGIGDEPNYVENDNDWAVRTLGQKYKYNPKLPFQLIPDRSLFILQSLNIPVSENEYLGIKLHDGLYEEANKAYLISFKPESRLRTVLPYVVHQADLLASRIEWEKDWFDNFRKGLNKSPKVTKEAQVKVDTVAEKIKKPTFNPKLQSILDNLQK